ncbi:MAG: thiosulfate sulfurtransferase [Micavibrio sp.]|nr:MAG: thiosulfate sulfurtransferase [Micavibrio sp.]
MIEEIVKQGIVEATTLHMQLNDPLVKLIDATFVMPGAADNPRTNWKKKRIGNAAFFDIDEIADQNTDLPHMLPSPEEFERAVSAMGIRDNHMVVVYGQSGMVMGPARAWWMFRTFGHDKVCVLNGGLPAWLKEGYKLNTEPPQTPTPSNFKAFFRPELVRNMHDITKAFKEDKEGKRNQGETVSIFDARPAPRFNGTAPEPRAGLRSGHIPGSRNIQASDLVYMENGKLKPYEELYEIFIEAGYVPGTPAITTCGSGVTACLIALALHNQGFNASVYDGSWAEWGQEVLQTEVETSKK